MSEKIDLKNLDKSNWKTFRFENIAQKVSKTVKPEEAEVDIYVGLEHLDGEDIHIRRHGVPSDVKGGKLKCYPGDIIFGKRRAYQRKAAIVDFNGICSAHAFVLRANPSVIDPKLFPFFLHSDQFMHRMVDISVGGLSPTINWGQLKVQEFLLPPKDQQAQLAELLWAMDEVVEKEVSLRNIAGIHYETSKSNIVLKGFNNGVTYSDEIKKDVAENWIVSSIGQLLEKKLISKIQDGNHGEIHPKSSDYVEEGIPFIMANTIDNGEINFEKSKKLPKGKTDKLRIGFSFPGDILLSHKGTVGQVAIVPESIRWPYLMLTPQVTYYRTDPAKLSNKFLYYVFTSSYFQKQLERLSSQSTRAYVGITSQQALKIGVPNSLSVQKQITDFLGEIEKNLKLLDVKIATSKAFQKSLINQIF